MLKIRNFGDCNAIRQIRQSFYLALIFLPDLRGANDDSGSVVPGVLCSSDIKFSVALWLSEGFADTSFSGEACCSGIIGSSVGSSFVSLQAVGSFV